MEISKLKIQLKKCKFETRTQELKCRRVSVLKRLAYHTGRRCDVIPLFLSQWNIHSVDIQTTLPVFSAGAGLTPTCQVKTGECAIFFKFTLLPLQLTNFTGDTIAALQRYEAVLGYLSATSTCPSFTEWRQSIRQTFQSHANKAITRGFNSDLQTTFCLSNSRSVCMGYS